MEGHTELTGPQEQGFKVPQTHIPWLSSAHLVKIEPMTRMMPPT